MKLQISNDISTFYNIKRTNILHFTFTLITIRYTHAFSCCSLFCKRNLASYDFIGFDHVILNQCSVVIFPSNSILELGQERDYDHIIIMLCHYTCYRVYRRILYARVCLRSYSVTTKRCVQETATPLPRMLSW